MSEPSGTKRGLPSRVRMRHGPHFVEELARRHDVPVGKTTPISNLEPNPDQPRSLMGDLRDLVESIRSRGILEPILVRPLPQKSQSGQTPVSRYQIVSGERRYRAALEAGLFEVPVIEMELTDQEALEVALIENLQRKDLSPFEEAEGYRALAENHGYRHEQIAEVVGKSRSSVTESLQLLHLPPRVREAAQALGIQAKSTLLEIAKAPNEETMIQLLERISSHGLSRDEVRREKRSLDRATAPGRRRPYTFRFRAPDRSFQLALTFRRSAVGPVDLIEALEQILIDLRQKAKESGSAIAAADRPGDRISHEPGD